MSPVGPAPVTMMKMNTMNNGFPNPYQDEHKSSVSARAQRLVSYLSIFLALDLTADERNAVGKVADGLFEKYPWVMEVPAVKEWLK